MPASQPKHLSLLETIAQNVVGLIIGAVLLAVWIGPHFAKNAELQALFFVSSFARGYVIRRIFAHLGARR